MLDVDMVSGSREILLPHRKLYVGVEREQVRNGSDQNGLYLTQIRDG